MRSLLIVLLFALPAAPAFGGGFATTGLSSLPDGVAPGEPWVVDVKVLWHGRTPATGLSPSITITNGSTERTFVARSVRPGVFRARVVFPEAGRWRYTVDSSFGLGPESFAPVEIREAQTASATTNEPRWAIALGAGLLAALMTALITTVHHRPSQRTATA